MSEELPRVGDTIYFYPTSSPTVPLAATVLRVWSPDIVDVKIWEVNRDAEKKAVNRRGCTALVNNPKIAQVSGSWDYRDPPEYRTAFRAFMKSLLKTEPDPVKAATEPAKTEPKPADKPAKV